MGKSIRSKAKRSFRSKKRTAGVYASAEAARLHRLSLKLVSLIPQAKPQEREGEPAQEERDDAESPVHTQPVESIIESMDIDKSTTSDTKAKRISTHGPRNSRRETWRASKGLDPLPKQRGMNRQGGIAARRKSGRPSRRR